jgi:hypothetical protein
MSLEVLFLILKLKSNSFLLVYIYVCWLYLGILEIIFILFSGLFNCTTFILFKSLESEFSHYIKTKKGQY